MRRLSEGDIARLETDARHLRSLIIDMLAHAPSGHTAGPLGLADVLITLYGGILNHNPADPLWEERDRLILSNGHCVPAQYAALALAGYFPTEELNTLRTFGARLQGHPERGCVPGIETTSGPLGEGLGQAAGIALGARIDQKTFRTYCIMSDGEQQCGATWEAAMFAAHYSLANLTAIIDRNHVQIGGTTETVMSIESLQEKYQAFGWRALLVDGHAIDMLADALVVAEDTADRPTVIIAETIPGKGVLEIEGDYRWHGKVPTREQADRWIASLETPLAQSE